MMNDLTQGATPSDSACHALLNPERTVNVFTRASYVPTFYYGVCIYQRENAVFPSFSKHCTKSGVCLTRIRVRDYTLGVIELSIAVTTTTTRRGDQDSYASPPRARLSA